MKARVKATGEIIECNPIWEELSDGRKVAYQCRCNEDGWVYDLSDIESLLEEIPPQVEDLSINYWTRLEHQYAGMAMQGIVSSYAAMREISKESDIPQYVANMAFGLAHALVEKYKKEEK